MELKVLYGLLFVLMFISITIWLTRPRRRRKMFLQFIYLGNDSFKIKSNNMATIFKPNQFAQFQVQPVDDKGKPAKVEAGSVDYQNPDPDSFTVEEDPEDETKFKVTSSAAEITESKSVDIKVSADADTGEGVRTIEGILVCVLEPRSAVGFGINTLSEPADVPEA